jgi:HSP20 family protein
MFLVPVSRESRQLSRLFDDAFERFLGPVATTETNGARSPALDVAESDRSYTVKLEMPGVAKEDIKVAVEGRQVSVQAHSERAEERKEGDRVVYRERSANSYARSFTLPMEMDQAESNAKLENGVLTLTLPKRAARTAASIAVN